MARKNAERSPKSREIRSSKLTIRSSRHRFVTRQRGTLTLPRRRATARCGLTQVLGYVGDIMKCPNCKSTISDTDVDLYEIGRNANKCPHCGTRLQQTLKSRVRFELISWALVVASVGLTALLFNAIFGTQDHRFFDQPKGLAKLEMIPFILLLVFLFHKIVGRFISFKEVQPSIGRQLSSEELSTMRNHHISYNGDYFSVQGMDFDHLQEAVDYALTLKKVQRIA